MIGNLDELTRPVIDIYDQIEMDLLEAVGRRFDSYREISGTLEWQLKKLDELGALNAETVRIIASYSRKSDAAIRKMLQRAGFGNIDAAVLDSAYRAGALMTNPARILESPVLRSAIEDGYRELTINFRMIRTKAVESVKEEYMRVLNRAYIETSSGIYDYNTSIRRALKDFADRGITAATYRRGEKTVHYSIEAAVRRDTLTAVHQAANRNSFTLVNELGAEYVEVSSHAGARYSASNLIANHIGWQGKVYKINGFDEKYGNLKNNTGYPDDIQGLGGVNCRHRMYPFFPGITEPMAMQYNEEASRRRYELTQRQRAKERRIRRLKKECTVMRAAMQPTEAIDKKLDAAYEDIREFCAEHGLDREWNREALQGE